MKKTKMFLFLIVGIIFAAAYVFAEENAATPVAEATAATEQITPEPTAIATVETVSQQTALPTAIVNETLVTDVTPQQTAEMSITPVEQATVAPTVEEKVNKIEVDNSDYGEEEGIVILNPGQTSTEELEKYITSKKKITPIEDGDAENSDVNVTFEGPDVDDGETGGIIVMEAESKEKISKAGYVMVERAGFLSDSFPEDGYIYDTDERDILMQGIEAYVKITVGKGIKKNMQFLIFTDKTAVEDPITGRNMGKLIDVRGVGQVIEKADEGIWLVKITKSYGPIGQNYKIKMRNDFKDYYNKITTKVKKSRGVVEAYIIKVQNDNENIKKKDIVYLNKGVKDGLLPGDSLTIYKSTANKETGGNDTYHKTGKLLIINSMKDSAVAVVTNQKSVIHVGDVVKTAK